MNLSACYPPGTLLPVIILVSICAVVHSWRLDCTKFVFAPRCRGVAAKRSSGTLNTQQYLPPAYPWKGAADIAPFQYSFPDAQISRRSSDLDLKSRMASLLTRPGDEVQSNSLLESWKDTDKYPDSIRDKQEQDKMKSYLEALWRSINDNNEDINTRR